MAGLGIAWTLRPFPTKAMCSYSMIKIGYRITQTWSKQHFKIAFSFPENEDHLCRSLAYFMPKILVCLIKSNTLDSLKFKSKAALLLGSWHDTGYAEVQRHAPLYVPDLYSPLSQWPSQLDSVSYNFHCRSLKYFLCMWLLVRISCWRTTTYELLVWVSCFS